MLLDPLMVEFRANMTEVPQYSLDSRPDWLPEGWDMEKTMEMTIEEWTNLTERVFSTLVYVLLVVLV
jgi:hypothetical protein